MGGGSSSRDGGERRTSRSSRMVRPMRTKITADIKIDYKNLSFLQRFVSERGKIVSRRLSGVSAKDQRKIAEAIRQARFLGLLSTGGVKK